MRHGGFYPFPPMNKRKKYCYACMFEPSYTCGISTSYLQVLADITPRLSNSLSLVGVALYLLKEVETSIIRLSVEFSISVQSGC